MTTSDSYYMAFIDPTPTPAKNLLLRPQLERELKEQLSQQAPAMVARLAELEPIITLEVGEYLDFITEAQQAFQYGLWRAVVALIGIAAERFTDNLYHQLKWVISKDGKQIAKAELFGRDDYLPELRKLTVLYLAGLVGQSSYDKLVKIKKLRDLYVHPTNKGRDVGGDAREAMQLFRSVLKERFDEGYTIKKGKIVTRKPE